MCGFTLHLVFLHVLVALICGDRLWMCVLGHGLCAGVCVVAHGLNRLCELCDVLVTCSCVALFSSPKPG